MNNSILQHGSILCSTEHKMLTDYINCDLPTRNNSSIELTENTTEIETILNEKIDYDKLKKCLVNGFEIYWRINFEDSVNYYR